MDENAQATNPFSSDWRIFGFNGEPADGFDYSWSEVQNYLGFVGFDNYVQNCRLFSSSLNPNIFMVRTENDFEEIWDISDISFEFLSNDLTILVAIYDDMYLHISNVSTSFIELLMKIYKIPLNTLSDFNPYNSLPFKIKMLSPQTVQPTDSSKIVP